MMYGHLACASTLKLDYNLRPPFLHEAHAFLVGGFTQCKEMFLYLEVDAGSQ